MDDLTMLRESWEQPAPLSREARFRARSALMTRAAGEESAAAREPAGSPPGLRRPLAGHLLPRRLLPRPLLARRLLPRVGLRVAVAGALAVAVAAGIAVAQDAAGPDGGRLPAPVGPVAAADARQVLERAALVAERRPYTAPRPDQWVYTEDRATGPTGRPAGTAGPLPRRFHAWHRVDGTQEAWIEGGKLRVVKRPKPPNKRGRPPIVWEDYPSLTRLPTDPDALLRLARRGSPRQGNDPDSADEAVYSLFTHVLRGNALPPRVEAAIYRAMARIPGVTLNKTAVDVLGRPTLSLGMGSGWLHEETLLDRQTFAYRGERSLAVRDAVTDKVDPNRKVRVRKGTEFVFARTATAIVDRPGQLP